MTAQNPQSIDDGRLSPRSLPTALTGLKPLGSDEHEMATDLRVAAVCMLFIPNAEDLDAPAQIVLTRRSAALRSHKGQIGFPGGGRERQDVSLMATALRETEEELAIPAAKIKIHGHLPMVKALAGFPVVPFVGSAAIAPTDMTPNPSEVAEVILVPWPLLTRAAGREFDFTLFGLRRKSYVFPFGPHNIWGLTAKMIYSADMR